MQARPGRGQEGDDELRATKERLALALEAAELSVWDWDIPSQVLSFVPPMTEVLGYPSNDAPSANDARDRDRA